MTSDLSSEASLSAPDPARADLTVVRRGRDPLGWCEALPAAAGRTVLVAGRVTPLVGTVAPTPADLAHLAGQLRMAVRAIARVDLPPAEALGHLDGLVAEWDEPFAARLLYGIFDPIDGAFCFAQAGHPTPVVCAPDGTATALEAPEGGPLGEHSDAVGATVAYGEQSVTLPPGGSLAVFTLVDEPTSGAVAGAAPRVAAGLVGGGRDADAVADLVVRALDADGGAVLVARWPETVSVGPVRIIELELGEGEDPTRRARAFCYGVLSTWQLPPLVRDDIVLAVSELVANALLYGGAAEQLRLRRSSNRIVIEVFDRESTMPRPRIADADAESGRGLFLVRRVARRWGARAVPGGKAVWCEFEIPDPADTDQVAACG